MAHEGARAVYVRWQTDGGKLSRYLENVLKTESVEKGGLQRLARRGARYFHTNLPGENIMPKSFTKRNAGLAAAVAMALAIVSSTASAQPTAAQDSGYVTDTRGNVPMSAFGLCWHDGGGPAPISPA